jgi:simple sugar transport system ATP-binding protein
VAFSGLKARLTDLSGGNQQKVCLARVMEGSPRLVLLEQPGRGLDVRAQERLHRRIRELNENGVTFVLFSHDLDELLALSHRIGILFRGRLMGITGRQGVSPELLGKWMLGVE